MLFHFAWVDAADSAWSEDFAREDVSVFSFRLAQKESDAATLDLTIRNPAVGLLNAARKQWLWFSVTHAAVTTPLFFGRIVGQPSEFGQGDIRVLLRAAPADFEAVKRVVAAGLRVLPYYDPVWVQPARRDDPDAVLEGRAAHWHVDPVTHAVTAAPIDVGPAGTVDFGGNFLADSLTTDIGEAPLTTVECRAEVSWDQGAENDFDITPQLIAAFHAAGTPARLTGYITSYTGGGLMSDWPVEGKRIGGVWAYGACSITRHDGWRLPEEYKQVILTQPAPQPGELAPPQPAAASFPLWKMVPVLKVRQTVRRRRTESVHFVLTADAQAVAADPGDAAMDLLQLASADIALPIDPPEAVDGPMLTPIRDRRRASYFKTDRGRGSLEAAISIARARMIARARCVRIGFQVPPADALALTLRHNARIADARLPGGAATGKVTALDLALDGSSGVMSASVSMACMAGKGATVTASDGVGVYVADGYVEDGYQQRTGRVVMPASGDVTYDDYLGQPIDDDGLDLVHFGPDQAVVSLVVYNGQTIQTKVLSGFAADDAGWSLGQSQPAFPDMESAIEAVNDVYTQVDLVLLPIEDGPFRTDFEIVTSPLMLAKSVELD